MLNLAMSKEKASKLINSDFLCQRLKSKRDGNVKWANIKQNVFFIRMRADKRLEDEYHFILNNKVKREFIYMIIPPYVFLNCLFSRKIDKKYDIEKFNIRLSNEKNNYLNDINSSFDFSKLVTKVYQY